MEREMIDISHITGDTSIPTAMKLWEMYLVDQDKSPYTIKAFMGDLRLLAKFLPPDATISSVTQADLNRFIEWLENGRGKDIPCSPKSLSRRVTTLKSFFRWLFDHKRIEVDPAEKVLQKTVISPLPEVLSDDELGKVYAAAREEWLGEKKDPRPLALLSLLLESGIKKSECLNIKLPHIETRNGNYLFVRYADGRDRNKERKIPLSIDFVEVYQAYLEKYQPQENAFPWSPRRLEYLLEDISTSANIDKHLSFSMCRWNSALIDWKNGQDKDAIRQKLGISKIQWREISMKLEKLAASD
jgi:integrase/recombinase XerD